MTTGFVFINTGPKANRHVYDELSKIKQITDLCPLLGDYDMLAKVQSEDFETMRRIVAEKIRPIEGVVGTKTYTGMTT